MGEEREAGRYLLSLYEVGQAGSSPPPTWSERLAAATLLAGLPLHDSKQPCPRALELCQRFLGPFHEQDCQVFREQMARQARERSGEPVMGLCPVGLACFALALAGRQVLGGYVRSTREALPKACDDAEELKRAWSSLPVRCLEELDRVARSLHVLLEVPGPLGDPGRGGLLLSSALDLDPLMTDILNLAVRWLGADAGCLDLVERQSLTRRATLVLRAKPEPGRNRVRPSLAGWFRERSAKNSAETRFSTTSPLHPQDYASALFVPLSLHDRPRALLSLYFCSPRHLTSREILFLDALTVQAALALDNAHVFEVEQRRARESTALYQAARSIESGQTRTEVLEAAARALSRTAEVDRALVFLVDRHRPVMSLATSVGLTPDQREFFSAFRLNLGQIAPAVLASLQAGEPLRLPAPPEGSPSLARLLTLLPSSSCLVVPILGEDGLAGLALLDHSKGTLPFADSAVWLAMALAVQVGVALRRATLFEELQENVARFRALYQVSTVVTGTLSLPRLLQLIVVQALSLVQESACAVLVLNETGEDHYIHTSVGLPQEVLDQSAQTGLARLARGKRKASVLYLDRCPELAASSLGRAMQATGFGGLLAVPLVARKRTVGVLNCFAPVGRPFQRLEIRLLRGFANHAAVAVDHARLHGKLRLKMGELQTLFEVSRAVTSTLQLEKVFNELVQHVVRILRADACTIRLLEGNVLILKASEGLNPSNLVRRVPLGEQVMGRAAQGRQPITMSVDQQLEGLEFPRAAAHQGMRTVLSVPIDHRDVTVGVITIFHRAQLRHTPSDIGLLSALASHAGVAIENARIYAEKEKVSALLHDALIPRRSLGFPGLVLGHRFLPSRDLSGDYYDLIPLGPRRCGLVIGDVSGKGPEAAIQTIRAKHLLRSFAMSGHPPREVLRRLNSHLTRDDKDDDRQITLFYAEADLETRRLYYSCGGHEPALLWQPDGQIELLEADGILLGVVSDARFEERSASIPEGSTLLMCTDGITEARNPLGQFFGPERVQQTVLRYGLGERALSPQSLADRLYTQVRQFTRSQLSDDLSVLVARF
jgi:serine phosphatase RsbU (regulator of sigma subunit)